MPADLDVLQRGQVLKKLHELKRADEPARRDAFGCDTGDLFALEEDAAACRFEETRDHAEQRRLAGAVRSDDRGHALGWDLERHSIDGRQSAELPGEIVDAQTTHCGVSTDFTVASLRSRRPPHACANAAKPPGA